MSSVSLDGDEPFDEISNSRMLRGHQYFFKTLIVDALNFFFSEARVVLAQEEIRGLCAAQSCRELSDVERIHFIFQRTQRHPKVLRSSRHVPLTFLERSEG